MLDKALLEWKNQQNAIITLFNGEEEMLKVIPVEEAVGLPLAHDITEIVPGKHKGPAFRRGHVIRPEDIAKLLDVGKAHVYVMELERDELHEEDAARRLAKAAAGGNLTLTDPVEGRVNLVAEISGLLKIDAELLCRFNSLGDLIMATLSSDRYVQKGTVVAGTRTIPVVVKESLIQQAEALCKGHRIVTIMPMPERRIHLIVTGSEVYTGRIKDGFEPVVRRKLQETGSDLAAKNLAPDEPDQIANLIQEAHSAGAELILVSGGSRGLGAAIARTLALQPDLLLMDEPFSSLDAVIREDLQALTLELCAEGGITLVIVTHNIEEAAAMGHKILLLGTPPNRRARIFENPAAGKSGQRESKQYQELCQTLRRELSNELS